MSKFLLIFVFIMSFAGIGYWVGSYFQSSQDTVQDTVMEEMVPSGDRDVMDEAGRLSRHREPASIVGTTTTYLELKQKIKLSESDKIFLKMFSRADLGQELFWLNKINTEEESHPEYQGAREDLMARLRAQAKKTLEGIAESLKQFPPMSYPVEKLRFLKMASLCEGYPELQKEISLSILEKEIIPKRPDANQAKSEAELNMALSTSMAMSVPLTAHALYLGVTEKNEAWIGTKEAIQRQVEPWVQTGMAQQYLDKYPDQKEVIRSDLEALLGKKATPAPVAVDSMQDETASPGLPVEFVKESAEDQHE
ncbi:MAG: hypothetical protein HYV97_15170 [Bdellovibrio sp.]|nr:hypothetical protein [Bdellovibrio sp.]